MRLALAQLNPMVGSIAGNAGAILTAYERATAAGAHVVAAGELALTGYPPEDLVLKSSFVAAVASQLSELASQVGEAPLVVGFVEQLASPLQTRRGALASEGFERPGLANAAAVLRRGRIESVYRKQRLPNYGVFDEARYFQPGSHPLVIDAGGARVGITICEDLWGEGGPVDDAATHGAQVVLNINASPYTRGKRAERESWAARHARTGGVWIAYLNQVGGQDEIVFDGDSFVMDPDGDVVARGPQFDEALIVCDVPLGDRSDAGFAPAPQSGPRLDPIAEVHAALVLGTRDYVRKNGFDRALLGLSGGVDSALVAALAAQALGPDAVTGVGMPSPYSSPGSLTDAKQLVANLGIRWAELPIERIMAAFDETLAEPFAGTDPGVAEENIQSRVRGALLMALSNKHGDIVLATGNKSEYAVGYSTLYGDMAGGFAIIKDVPKTLVYQLCRHINATRGQVIPQAILDKPPSAELRPGQRDTDSLPPYEVLDPILQAYVEEDCSVAEIVARGFDPDVVRYVAKLVDRSEYKRRQSAPGVKITPRAFGKDRRVPITQSWTG